MSIDQWIRADLGDSSKKNTIATLDSVRALACLSVIFFHINSVPHDFHVWNLQASVPALTAALLFVGRYGVTLFFVLSGFLLFLPFANALIFEQAWPSLRRFYLRRAFRILPAYYLTLILVVLLFQQGYLQPQRWGELALFFTFLMDSSKVTFKQLNAPFWTLAVEWQYYMVLPLLVLGMRLIVWRVKQGSRLPTTAACILALIAWGIFTRSVGNYFTQHPGETVLVPRFVLNGILLVIYGVSGKYLEDFGVGMLLSLGFAYAQHPSISPRWRAALRGLSPWLFGVGLLCLLFMTMWNYHTGYAKAWSLFDTPWLSTNYYDVNELGFSLSFGLCILALLFGFAWLKWPFERLSLRWVGMISYSLYMWHFPLLVVFIQHIQPILKGWPLALTYSAYWLWVLGVIIPFCFFFYLWGERPGIKFGERFTHQKAESASAAVVSPTPAHEMPRIEAKQQGESRAVIEHFPTT